MSDPRIRIGDLARLTHKTVRALRYYEEFGLLAPAAHTDGGFRLYRGEDADRVRLIERLQELGFSLDRIREAVGTWGQGGRGEDAAARLQGILEGGLRDTRARIARLQSMECEMAETLRFLATCRTCQDSPVPAACRECEKGDHRANMPPLLEALTR